MAASRGGRPRTPRLAPEDARLVRDLRERWGELFRLTTLEQGMLALGQTPDDERRLRLGGHLIAHPDLHPNLARRGARTFVLNEDEKLLGRYLAQRAPTGRGAVALAEAAQAVARSDDDARRRLEALRGCAWSTPASPTER